MQKRCYRCEKIKLLDAFYKLKSMADGHFNKCKECYKSDVKLNYRKNKEHYTAYERERCKDPERRKKALDYQRKRRNKNPGKNRARQAVNNAIRDGRIIKQNCEKCGSEKSQAHHSDYRSPLKVMWLCFKHHREEHGQKVL
jgi:hypothetical protein